MANEMQKLGTALKKATANGGTLLEKLDPATVPEGSWKGKLPPAKYYLDSETGQQVAVPVVAGGLATSDVPPALEQHVLELYGQGIPGGELERRFDLGKGYIRNALLRRFGSEESLTRALKSLLLENGVATAQHTLANVESLHPSQSGMLAATMTNAFIALDKHQKNTPRQVDFSGLASFAEALERIERYAGIASEEEVIEDDDDAEESSGTDDDQ